MRSGLFALVVAAVAATCVAPATGATSLPRCHTADVSVMLGRVDAGAGQRNATLTLRNTGDRRCRTQGWVGLQLEQAQGQEVPTEAMRIGSPSKRVVLDPGERARTTLGWGAIPDETEPQTGVCEPVARYLRVTPPDETATKRLRWKGGPVCESGRILVRPLHHV